MLDALLEELIEAAPASRWARMKAMRGPAFMRKKFSTQTQLKQRAKFAKVPKTTSPGVSSSSAAQASVAGISKTEAIAAPAMVNPVTEKNWMQAAFGKNPGALHRQLGVPEGEKIPTTLLNKEQQRIASTPNPTAADKKEAARIRLAKIGAALAKKR